MSSTTGACQACEGGGVTLPPSVEVTCISKQYQDTGQSGVGFLAGDWDGECNGVLPNASGSSGSFQPTGGVRVWPSVCILTPGFWPSRSLYLAAMIWQPLTQKQCPELKLQIGSFSLGTKAHARKLRNNWVCISHIWSTVSWRSIHLPPTDSLTDVRTLPTWEKVLTSLIEPPDWQFKGQSWTATA